MPAACFLVHPPGNGGMGVLCASLVEDQGRRRHDARQCADLRLHRPVLRQDPFDRRYSDVHGRPGGRAHQDRTAHRRRGQSRYATGLHGHAFDGVGRTFMGCTEQHDLQGNRRDTDLTRALRWYIPFLAPPLFLSCMAALQADGASIVESYMSVPMPPGFKVVISELEGPIFADARGRTLYMWPSKKLRNGSS